MEIIFATHNKNKLKEVQILMPKEIKLLSLEDIGMNEDIPETSNTISGNAVQKVQFIRQRFKLPVFADDTGLEVIALNNEPGVLSARYAGAQKNSNDNIDLLLTNLKNEKDRSARFVTVFALDIDGNQNIFEGVCEGSITETRYGTDGFGYDPIFMPKGFDLTFSQMSLTEKGAISHRGLALQKLIAYLSE